MTLEQLIEIWKAGKRRVWYSYEGLFAPMKVWDHLMNIMNTQGHEVLLDAILHYMINNHGFIDMYIPMDVLLGLVPSIMKSRFEFDVSWNILLPDICGRGSIGASLSVAENNENVFETFEECVEFCEQKNKQKTIYFDSTQRSTLEYLNVLRKAIDKCCQYNNFGIVKENAKRFTIAALLN